MEGLCNYSQRRFISKYFGTKVQIADLLMLSETTTYIMEVVVEMCWNYSSGDRFVVALDGTKIKMADFSVCWYCSPDRGLMNVQWNYSLQLLELQLQLHWLSYVSALR